MSGNSVGRMAFGAVRGMAAIALFLFAVRTAVVEANEVVSSSMNPTLATGDFILVNKLRYGLHLPFTDDTFVTWRQPARGDVVTFVPPDRYPEGRGRLFVKRVVAVAGDRVAIREGVLTVNGRPALLRTEGRGGVEELSGTRYRTFPGDGAYGPVTVPAGSVFAVGDNRPESNDSRYWGPLPVERIAGKAELIYFSGLRHLGRIGTLL